MAQEQARIAIPARIAPLDLGVECVVYEERHLGQQLSTHVDSIEFYVPPYMGSAGFPIMREMPRLQVCQLLTAGFENALPYVPAGVILCNAAGVHDASTAELALALILASLRGVDDAARHVPVGGWHHHTRPALADRHVMVIGAGGVGQAIRRRLEPFETTITMVGRTAREGVLAISDVPSRLASADVVVLAVPLDTTTHHLVDTAFLRGMRDGALLVNVSRGPVVDTDALVAELRAGRVRAALDVTDPEPLPADHPLWRVPGVLITPHVGGDTTAFEPRARALVTAQVERWRSGTDLAHVITGD